MQRIIYLAAPYTADEWEIKAMRAEEVNKVAARLTEAGHIVFSPITMGHEYAKYSEKLKGLPSGTWENFCAALFLSCNEMYILQLEGSEKSLGLKKEVGWAFEFGYPITVIEPKTGVEICRTIFKI